MPYKLKFYELDGWKIHQEIDGITTKLIEDDSGVTRIEGSYDNDNKFNFVFYNIKGDKGDPLTFEDLTEEQKAELGRLGEEKAQELIQQIDIGGANIIPDSLNYLNKLKVYPDDSNQYSYVQSSNYRRINLLRGDLNNKQIVQEKYLSNIDKLRDLTYSVIARTDGDITGGYFRVRGAASQANEYMDLDTTIQKISAENKKWKIYGTLKKNSPYLFSKPIVFQLMGVTTESASYIEFGYPKVEYGNQPTDWTPALEDESSGGSSLDDAPSDGKVYSRKNGEWINSVINVTGLSDLINSGTANAEDIKRIFGTNELSELKEKLSAGIVFDIETTTDTLTPYILSVDKSDPQELLRLSQVDLDIKSDSTIRYINMIFPSSGGLNVFVGKKKFIIDAPSDGKTYGRKNGAWSKTVGKVDPNSDGTGEVYNDYTNNVATGSYSHAEGIKTTASGSNSHAEGYYTTASGSHSHAEGIKTTAKGNFAHTEGYYTSAFGNYAHAEGVYNVSNNGSTDADKSIHMVGIGTSESNRKNAHEIMTNGDHYIYGIGGYNGKNYSEAKTLQEVITELTTQIETLQTTINELKGGQE